jgi:hypothetical protein
MSAEVLQDTSTDQKALDAPARYWTDSDWFISHIGELSKLYPNQWVIVYNEKVIAAHRDLGVAEDAAELIVGPVDRSFPMTAYVESGRHVF